MLGVRTQRCSSRVVRFTRGAGGLPSCAHPPRATASTLASRAPGGRRPARHHTLRFPLQVRSSGDSAEVSEEDAPVKNEHVSATTTDEGILILHRVADAHSKFMVRRVEDEDIEGHGMMVENWFLAGDTPTEYCEVDKNGDLVCSLSKPGLYSVREIMEDGELHVEHEIVCREGEEGKLEWEKLK